MNTINQTPAVYSALYHRLNKAIHSTVVKTFKRCKNRAQEPDYVAGLALDFTQDLFVILQSVYKGVKFSVSGIFCHQKPLAHILNSTPDPEIGDILFVLINTDRHGRKRLNSMLFQAKMSNKLMFTVATSDEHQLRLYTQWPKFAYKRAGILSGVERSINPKSVSSGAQFRIIDDDIESSLADYPGTFCIGCAVPDKYVVVSTTLADEIINFIMHRSGRPFGDYNRQYDDWSRLIWDLITITKNKASRRINSGLNSFARNTTKEFDGLYFLAGDTRTIFSSLNSDAPYEYHQQADIFEDTGGISLVLLESFDTEG